MTSNKTLKKPYLNSIFVAVNVWKSYLQFLFNIYHLPKDFFKTWERFKLLNYLNFIAELYLVHLIASHANLK